MGEVAAEIWLYIERNKLQPFAEHFHRLRQQPAKPEARRGHYLFAQIQGEAATLVSTDLSWEIFRQAQYYLGGARLAIQGYRQVVVGVVKPVKPYDKSLLLPFAEQGITLRTFLHCNDRAFPTRLQPERARGQMQHRPRREKIYREGDRLFAGIIWHLLRNCRGKSASRTMRFGKDSRIARQDSKTPQVLRPPARLLSGPSLAHTQNLGRCS